MRRFIVVISLLLILTPVFATVQFGYSLAPVGEHSPLGDNFGALSISASLSPWAETRVGDMEVEVLLSPVSPFFNGVNMKVSSPLFLTVKHPFSFMFPNPVYWAPRISVGAQYRMETEWSLYASLSPFTFQDTRYIYEFMSPYVLYNFEENKWGYGAYILRFTVFLGADV